VPPTGYMVKVANLNGIQMNNVQGLTSALAGKQATLVSGTTIRTVENTSLLGSGNLDITKAMVGLGSADNTSDLNKPISTATQNALNLKANSDRKSVV